MFDRAGPGDDVPSIEQLVESVEALRNELAELCEITAEEAVQVRRRLNTLESAIADSGAGPKARGAAKSSRRTPEADRDVRRAAKARARRAAELQARGGGNARGRRED